MWLAYLTVAMLALAFGCDGEKAQDLRSLPKPLGLKQLAVKVKEVLSGAPALKRVG